MLVWNFTRSVSMRHMKLLLILLPAYFHLGYSLSHSFDQLRKTPILGTREHLNNSAKGYPSHEARNHHSSDPTRQESFANLLASTETQRGFSFAFDSSQLDRCAPGQYKCESGGGCCPDDTNCVVTLEGELGCCLVGETCRGGGTCTIGYSKCPNGGCCMTGYICSGEYCKLPGTDDNGKPCDNGYFECSEGEGGGCCKNGFSCDDGICIGPPE